MLVKVMKCKILLMNVFPVLQGHDIIIIYPRRPELPVADKVPVHFSALPEYILDDMADFLLFIVQ